MFYDKYLDEYYLEELYQNYDLNFLKSVDKENFDKIYNLFKNYKFDYIEDIILGYLDIFTLNDNVVKKKIEALKKALGDNYIDIIGEDMSYLEYIAKE